MKKYFSLVSAAILGSLFTWALFSYSHKNQPTIIQQDPAIRAVNASYTGTQATGIDFTTASEQSVEAVVHVTNMNVVDKLVYKYSNPIDEFFGFGYVNPEKKQEVYQSSGSGVIFRADGYIITNNHVIDGADEINIVLNNNKNYKAKVIGTDPSTDLAVLKIEAENLPFLTFANSDAVRVGEWVLAVGNPFNLSSTVTAGIVSAKARNINILKEKSAIESFIQTDAAVNPGNSGGALVNLNGELIGINTAIATPTGTFTGYSFAVPSNIVAKVVDDLIRFGIVQRAYLGVQLAELNDQVAEEFGISVSQGVYINGILPNGAAEEAGLKTNDVISKIDDLPIKQTSELLEVIGRHRPGDVVKLTLLRGTQLLELPVTLTNEQGTTAYVTEEEVSIEKSLGAVFVDLNINEKKQYGINFGVKVTDVGKGKLKNTTNMNNGFIITHVDEQPVQDKATLYNMLKKKKGGVMLEGFYPGYYGRFYYALGL